MVSKSGLSKGLPARQEKVSAALGTDREVPHSGEAWRHDHHGSRLQAFLGVG